MLSQKSTKAQFILIITILVLISVVVSFVAIFFGIESTLSELVRLLFKIILRMGVLVSIFGFLAPRIIEFLDRKIGEAFTLKRLIIELLSIIVLSVILASAMYYLFPPELYDQSQHPVHPIAKSGIMIFILGSIIFSLYEVWKAIYKNQTLTTSLALLEKEKLGLKLSSLQQKLNPHFLFNSLNVLSELIYEDTKKADKFIHQFSQIYRYVLELNDEHFVSLEKELHFLEAYEYLLKIRMDDTLVIVKDLPINLKKWQIPPLSLQLLIENAIKHNRACQDSPLVINISIDENCIIVSNNVQRQNQMVKGIGLGLQKLRETYLLLSEKAPQINSTEKDFVVTLPLIQRPI